VIEAGGLKKKKNKPPGRKERKGNHAFSIRVADVERTMSKMLNSYNLFSNFETFTLGIQNAQFRSRGSIPRLSSLP